MDSNNNSKNAPLNNRWLLAYLFIPILTLNFGIFGENQYVYLADSFLKGSLSLVQLPPLLSDFAYFNGQYYWPAGILPAITLMPFVAIFGTGFQEGFTKLPLTILNFWLVFKICKTFNLSLAKSLLLALFFIFGSVYAPIATIPWSVYLAQVFTTFGLLLAIYLFITKKTIC